MHLNQVVIKLGIAEERRPGITKLADRIRREHPDLSHEDVYLEAKNRYSSPRIVVEKDGVPMEIDNPDYMAARDSTAH